MAFDLEVVDPNSLTRAGVILEQIEEEIRSAAVVIAELTGKNPNVYYETAIADMLKERHRVILLAREDEEVGFDLRSRRLIQYADSVEGAQQLERRLNDFLRQALEGSGGRQFEVIEGPEERTRRMVADLALHVDEATKGLVVRFEGGLTPLAISDQEQPRDEYRSLLGQERDGVIELLRRGATFRAILAPRVLVWRSGLPAPQLSHLSIRFKRLIEVLEGKARIPLDRVEMALLEPGYVRSSLLIGQNVLYDGIKASVAGGYHLTTRTTDTSQIRARINAFDSLHEEAISYTLQRWGHETDGEDRSRKLRQAIVRGVNELATAFENDTPFQY